MTCSNNALHIGSIGFSFNIQIISNFNTMDISEAVEKKVYFKKPDGTKINRNLSFFTNGTDGKLIYETVSGDIDLPGVWQMQANIVTPTDTWWTSIETFTVQGNLS